MPLDPDLRPLLDLVAASPKTWEQTPSQARDAFSALAVGLRKPELVASVGSVEDVTLPGGDGPRPARVYRPEGAASELPTVLLFHGGGFVIGDLETHDDLARLLCSRLPAVVVSLDYRLAPEHPFPAGIEDALAATRAVAADLATYGGSEVLVVSGDSAGGNFAAVVAQAMPDQVSAQLLMYPAVDMVGDHPSRTENAEGYFLDLPTMGWFMEQYLPESVGADPADLRLSPILAESFQGLPPAVVVTAELDPLRDEGEAYAAALEKAGVEVRSLRFDGMIHGFLQMGSFSPAAQRATEETVDLLGELLTSRAAPLRDPGAAAPTG